MRSDALRWERRRNRLYNTVGGAGRGSRPKTHLSHTLIRVRGGQGLRGADLHFSRSEGKLQNFPVQIERATALLLLQWAKNTAFSSFGFDLVHLSKRQENARLLLCCRVPPLPADP